MPEVEQQINAVTRTVGTRELEAGTANVVTIAQSCPAPVADVWDACTNADRIPRWFMPISGDLSEGGRYQLEGNAGGTVQRCDPPNGFDATWEFGGATSWIEVRLTAEDQGSTRMELRHIELDNDNWAEYGPGAVGVGWDMGLLGLAVHFAGDAAYGAEWIGSSEGSRFAWLSSKAWCAANIAAGTPEAQATACADRTTAAYTAPPEGA